MNTNEEVVYLHLDDIIPNRFQPREVFDEKPLKELAVSIKEHGVIQPIIVRKVNDKYEIIAGERRYKASALAGLTKIPAIIRNLDDKESSKVALLENLQRKNLNAIEEAKTYQKILELDEMTQDDLAKTMGKSQSAVSNKLRLLSLPEEVQDALMKDKISERHARALLNLEEKEKQKELLKQIMEEKMTVRKLETKINEITGKSAKEETTEQPSVQKTESSPNTSLPELKSVPTTESYIPENPILPNFNGENSSLNTPILSNISSVTNETQNSEPLEIEEKSDDESGPKFINFGEIDDDESDDDDEGDNLSLTPTSTEPINIDALKANATDITSMDPNANDGNSNLDSLLNLESIPLAEEPKEDGFKFFSPANEAIQDTEEDNKNTESDNVDYFKTPDLIDVDLPSTVQTNNVNSVELPQSEPETPKIEESLNIDNSIEKIKDLVAEIKKQNIKINMEEADLDDTYQIIIKINKEK